MTLMLRILGVTSLVLMQCADARDACMFLAASTAAAPASTPVEYEITGKPYCNYMDKCVGITSVSSGGELIPCKKAYEIISRRTAHRISVPPIVETSSVATDALICSEEQAYERSDARAILYPPRNSTSETILTRLEQLSDQIRDRITGMHYRFLYEDEIDGPLLRNFTDAIQTIVNPAGGSDGPLSGTYFYRTYLRTSPSYRKLARLIGHILHHVASRPMNETELIIGSVAPWVHAFTHSLFMTKVVFPGFFKNYGFILKALVTFHPRYVSDDGIWYLYLESDFQTDPLELHLYERNERVTWDDMEDFFMLHTKTIPPRDPRLIMERLEEMGTEYRSGNDLEESYAAATQIEYLVYALEYISTYENITRFASPALIRLILPLVRGDHFLYLTLNPVTVESLGRIFRDVLPLEDKAWLPPQLSLFSYVPLVQTREWKRRITHRYHGRTGFHLAEIVENLMSQSRDDLFRQIEWDISTDDEDEDIDPPDTFQAIPEIMDLFSADLGGGNQSNTHTEPDSLDMCSHQLQIHPSVAETKIDTQIALGRFVGILLSQNLLDVIIGTHMCAPQRNASIFETVFFNSRYVRQGFYDVYLEGSLEDTFVNGNEFLEAMTLRSD